MLKKILPVLFLFIVFPANVKAQASDCFVRVNWTQIEDIDNDFVGYYLYRRGANEAYSDTPIAVINNIASTEYEDMGVEDGIEYHYAVRSVDDVGNFSPFSSDADVKVICKDAGTTPVSQAVVDAAQLALKLPGGQNITETIIQGAVLVNNTGVYAPSLLAGGGALAVTAQTPTVFLNLPTIFLGYIKRRRKKWGVVYNSETKLGIPSALVILSDGTGNVKTDITDKLGRFDFAVKPGKYSLQVRVNNFSFPSKKIRSGEDDIYTDIYLGGDFNISEKAVSLNVPLDPEKVSEKTGKVLDSRYIKEKLLLVISKITKVLFGLGFFWAFLSWILAPSIFKFLVLIFYLAFAVLMQIGRYRNRWGKVVNQSNKPVAKAIVKLLGKKGETLDLAYTDKNGQYSFLVNPGQYQLSVDIVDIKDPFQGYKNVYRSEFITFNKEAVIRDKIKI